MSIELTQALSELAEINPRVDLNGIRGDTPVSFIPMSDVSDSGQWTGRQERPLDDVRVGYTPFVENDVLFAKITPCMENGKGAHLRGLKNGLGLGSTEFHVLRARGKNNPRFLFHWVQSRAARLRAVAYMGGSAGQQRVQADFFSQFRIPRVQPKEQSRIAAILDTMDEAIAKTEAVIAKLKQVRAGLLHDLLSRGLDENGQLRDPVTHPEQFQDSPLGRIPKEWLCQSLQEAAEWFSGGTPDRSRASLWQGNVPLLTPKDMKGFELSDTSEHISDEAVQIASKLMPEGTIFIVVRGMILAHTFPVCLSTRPFCFNQDIKAVRGRSDLINRFLGYWFSANSHLFLRKATEATHGTKKLDLSELHRVYIAFPSPPEQQAIIDEIETIDSNINLHASETNKLDLLKSGLMTDLLTGRVRVPEGIAVT
jgi:type I restriction enzyme S subunit